MTNYFEMVLLNIRSMTISYCSKKKRKNRERQIQLENLIRVTEELIIDNIDPNHILVEILTDLKSELEDLRENQMNGLLIRAKAQWIESGEKPTKYFCNLEKRNYVNKNITKIIQGDGKIINDQDDLLNEIKNFYENLYASKDNELEEVDLDILLGDYEVPKIDNEIKSELDRPITMKELAHSVKCLKNGKSPGPDGYTTELNKFFWIDLKFFITKSLTMGIQKGELSLTQKQGVVSLLPKGNKPRELLKNWRPISLLNVSYKILSNAVAYRLKDVLNSIMHENQRVFFKR
ncbi:hypothetical protein CI610_03104 [invertebrate metagenome]|uniref:Uncharacterized protein n=1 Tax=invertebrate metagenome TaxID=1711999 RepID=A0A2H9T406_9ZZZZ